MQIRRAELKDAEIIAEYNCRLARETESLTLDRELIGPGVRAVLGDPAKGFYFVAESRGEVVGQVMITFEWSDWRNGNIWWLQSVYVRADYRGRGVFRKLFQHVSDLAEQTPEVCGLRLYMHAANEVARSSYLKLGMKQTEYVVFEMGHP